MGLEPTTFCMDKAAARAHWARVYAERARERNAAAREQLAMLADRRECQYGERTKFG